MTGRTGPKPQPALDVDLARSLDGGARFPPQAYDCPNSSLGRIDSVMDRRTFIRIATQGLLVVPLAAWAQQPAKVYKVGLVLTTSPLAEMIGPDPVHPLIRAFLDELRAQGYVQGRNLVFEPRSAEGKVARFGEIVEDLVSLKVDVLWSPGFLSRSVRRR